jgi:hypothetical protein
MPPSRSEGRRENLLLSGEGDMEPPLHRFRGCTGIMDAIRAAQGFIRAYTGGVRTRFVFRSTDIVYVM